MNKEIKNFYLTSSDYELDGFYKYVEYGSINDILEDYKKYTKPEFKEISEKEFEVYVRFIGTTTYEIISADSAEYQINYLLSIGELDEDVAKELLSHIKDWEISSLYFCGFTIYYIKIRNVYIAYNGTRREFTLLVV